MGEHLVKRYSTVKLYGVEESEVRETIADLLLLKQPSMRIDNLDTEMHIILSASGDSEDEAKNIIKPIAKKIKSRFGNRIYSTKTKETLEMAVVRLLEKHDLTLSTAESCTGGLLAGRIINVPGVSEVFKEGFITYTNKSKRKTLNVSKGTLKKYGAVSTQTAKEMATGAIFASASDVSVAVTGIAGPDGGTEAKPVGLVYIACYVDEKIKIEEHRFQGDRQQVREQSVTAALDLLRRVVLERYS